MGKGEVGGDEVLGEVTDGDLDTDVDTMSGDRSSERSVFVWSLLGALLVGGDVVMCVARVGIGRRKVVHSVHVQEMFSEGARESILTADYICAALLLKCVVLMCLLKSEVMVEIPVVLSLPGVVLCLLSETLTLHFRQRV